MSRGIQTSLLVLLAVSISSAISCAPKVNVENPSAFEEDDLRASDGQPRPASDDSVFSTPPAPRGSEQIARSDFDKVVASGPGPYMRHIDVDPVMSDTSGVLRGWQIVRWPYTFLDLRAGDVVLSINGHKVIRPDDVAALWDDLPGSDAIEVVIERQGTPATLRNAIVDKNDENDENDSATGDRATPLSDTDS